MVKTNGENPPLLLPHTWGRLHSLFGFRPGCSAPITEQDFLFGFFEKGGTLGQGEPVFYRKNSFKERMFFEKKASGVLLFFLVRK